MLLTNVLKYEIFGSQKMQYVSRLVRKEQKVVCLKPTVKHGDSLLMFEAVYQLNHGCWEIPPKTNQACNDMSEAFYLK